MPHLAYEMMHKMSGITMCSGGISVTLVGRTSSRSPTTASISSTTAGMVWAHRRAMLDPGPVRSDSSELLNCSAQTVQTPPADDGCMSTSWRQWALSEHTLPLTAACICVQRPQSVTHPAEVKSVGQVSFGKVWLCKYARTKVLKCIHFYKHHLLFNNTILPWGDQ